MCILSTLSVSFSCICKRTNSRYLRGGKGTLPSRALSLVEGSSTYLFNTTNRATTSMVIGVHRRVGVFTGLEPIGTCPGAGSLSSSVSFVVIHRGARKLCVTNRRDCASRNTITEHVVAHRTRRHVVSCTFGCTGRGGGDGMANIRGTGMLGGDSNLFGRMFCRITGECPRVTARSCCMSTATVCLVAGPRDFSIVMAAGLFKSVLSSRNTNLIKNLNLVPSTGVNRSTTLFRPIRNSTPSVTNRNGTGPVTVVLSTVVVLECLNRGRTTSGFSSTVLGMLGSTGVLANSLNNSTAAVRLTRRIGGGL